MKKKIISLFTMFCLVLPCFLAVGCKNKKEPAKAVEPYTYSVVLKNAKGLIDENSLQGEFDYVRQENVDWESSGNDYTLTVSRKNLVSGSLAVSLLEGYDYTNIAFSVNNESVQGEIKSGENSNCADKAYLTDRQFLYNYEDMGKETTLELDFSNCKWDKVLLNMSELNSQGIKTYKAVNEFVTINTELSNSMVELADFNENVVEVDYGTVIAFSCGEKLVFKAETSNNFQNLMFARYGANYYTQAGTENVIQYFTAKQDGDCVVYNAVKDYSKRGTLRAVGCSDIVVYSSLENLENEIPMSRDAERETYGGASLKIDVFAGSKMFIELTGGADNFNYYLASRIDESLSQSNKVTEVKTLEGTERKYLEIDISKEDGSADLAKYLLRQPKTPGNYYIVYAKNFADNTTISNADYVLVGSTNKPTIPESYSGNVFYGFLASSEEGVKIDLSLYTSNKTSDYVQKNLSVGINAYNINKYNEKNKAIDTIIQSPETAPVAEVKCYSAGHDFKFYEIALDYVPEQILDVDVTLDVSDFALYAGEKVYYTTDITDSNSWRELTTSSEISMSSAIYNSGSSANVKTIYYYFESNRTDAFLQVQASAGEVMSVTGELKDCFGRKKQGEVMVGDFKIDLSKVCYLQINPSGTSITEAKLLREYDKSAHIINMSQVAGNVIMVSYNNFEAGNFKLSRDISIKYNSERESNRLYYYVDSETNKYLVLKDAQGVVVAESVVVKLANKEFLQIDGNYVYELSLIGDYYDENEEFFLTLEDSKYSLADNQSAPVSVYANSELTGETEQWLTLGKTYYFVGESDKDYKIIDSNTNLVVQEIESVRTIDATTSVFSFVLAFPANVNYLDGARFILKA